MGSEAQSTVVTGVRLGGGVTLGVERCGSVADASVGPFLFKFPGYCRQGINDQWEMRPPRLRDWVERPWSQCVCGAGVNVVGVKSYEYV